MPHAPAVGAATILPIEAFHSAAASAYASARASDCPPGARFFSESAISFDACPPVSPDTLFVSGFIPCATESNITCMVSRIFSATACSPI